MSMNLAAVARPSSLGVDLDQMLLSRFLAACRASRVWLAAELPFRLARCVSKLSLDVEWRAYTEGSRIFFAIARRPAPSPARTPARGPTSSPNRRQGGAPDDQVVADAGASMDVYFLDHNAAVYSAASWCYGSEQGWWLDAVLPPSYDPQHGWWLEAVMAGPAVPVTLEASRTRPTRRSADRAVWMVSGRTD